MKLSTSGIGQQAHEGEKKCLNSELWHACAGPLVSLPMVGSRVVYLPQGHSEQVSATTNKEVDAHLPNYPSLSPQLICQLHNVTMHADVDTDEVYAQMTLQPLTQQEQNDAYLPVELGVPSRQPTNYFCKTLTASDTSTHGGFSVPRRAAEKVFPPLDFSQTPPAQELIARDLHDVEWKFRHIFRGQPKRHLLTTGWSVFVSAKRLVAGDSVLFIWNENNQLFLGIRRANRPQTVMPSSVLSSDSMHIGLLAAAAHAAATNSSFTVFYNPRASPSEFVITLLKYAKAVYHTRVSVGMRFRMLFETEESTVRRYMGTITGIGDLDPVRWPKSHWRSVKVGWDESTAGERQPRVSLWEIEPLTTFPMYPSLFPPRLKRPWYPGASSFQDGTNEMMAWSHEQGFNPMNNILSAGMLPWMQQRFDPSLLRNDLSQQYQAMLATGLQNQLMQQFQQSAHHNPLSQPHQLVQPSVPSHVLPPQQMDNHEAFLIQNDHIPQRQSSDIPSVSNNNFSAHSSMQDLLGSLNHERNGDLLNFSSRPIIDEQSSQQNWITKFAESPVGDSSNSMSLPSYPVNDVSGEHNLDLHNHNLFGSNVADSSGLLLPTTVSRSVTSSVHAEIPLGYQNPQYGYAQDSSDVLHGTGQVERSGIFVKVYKEGCVGRSLDIARFSSYRELREALGKMFAVEGLLEDPQRSGWQLVFVDRENDVLLLGDDPWEAFVNNVWYIKILSPEDVQKLGKQEAESSLIISEETGRMMNNNSQNLVSGFPSLEY